MTGKEVLGGGGTHTNLGRHSVSTKKGKDGEIAFQSVPYPGEKDCVFLDKAVLG